MQKYQPLHDKKDFRMHIHRIEKMLDETKDRKYVLSQINPPKSK